MATADPLSSSKALARLLDVGVPAPQAARALASAAGGRRCIAAHIVVTYAGNGNFLIAAEPAATEPAKEGST